MNWGLSGFTLSRSSVLKFKSAKLDFVCSLVHSIRACTILYLQFSVFIVNIKKKKKNKYMNIMWKNVRCSIRIWVESFVKRKKYIYIVANTQKMRVTKIW